ncbi:hypothetical protein ACFP47_06545 [Nesterenkonia lacusekhoensis]|uniref:Amidohydrolase 3 domain-containing protein n=1 Tax=Nesterenkonia lacusekhoensis TaxID=150832 RepID=A0ABS4T0U9_9MICC|nr:hypothetical protein [Nesterenkonia lacusekhoensis]MBP2318076.1 hypothetical protein [Nesterenkonia lacusekhoensis]
MTTESTSATRAPRLLINGTVHSTTEPYAESLLVKDGLVAWVGDEDTARRGTEDTVEVQDLDRALVAPAFIGWVDSPVLDGPEPADSRPALDQALTLGYGAVRLDLRISRERFLGLRINTAEGEQSFDRYDAPGVVEQLLQQVLTEAREHPLPVFPHLHVTDMGGLDLEDPRSSSFLTEVVQMMRVLDEAAGAPLALAVSTEDLFAGRSTDQAEEILLEIRRTASGAQRQLIIDGADDAGAAAAGDRAAALVDAVVSSHERLRREKMTPSPATPTVLSGFDTSDRHLWERLLNTGVHVIFRAPGHLATALSVGLPSSAAPEQGRNPWELISQHVHHDADPVSVRAGFNAQVRGAYRSLAGGAAGGAAGGQLNPGAPATYAVWEVDSLAVQTPDSRTAAWSTDARARTPLLPYLDGESFPELVHTVIDGAILFSRDAE